MRSIINKLFGLELENKVVLITGASSGIGRECAFEFVKKGAKVVLAARTLSELEHVSTMIDNQYGESLIVKTDVRKMEDCESFVQSAIQKYGKIDILINNAGISMRAPFNEVKINVIKEMMDTNFYGTVYCTKFALPYLTEQQGILVGISSICGQIPLPGRTGYVASKHAMEGFLNTLRVEYLYSGLNVLVVHPGYTASNIRNVALNAQGVPQNENPIDESTLIPANLVAQKIVRACIKRKRDLILTKQGKLIVWIYRIFPSLADTLIYKKLSKERK